MILAQQSITSSSENRISLKNNLLSIKQSSHCFRSFSLGHLVLLSAEPTVKIYWEIGPYEELNINKCESQMLIVFKNKNRVSMILCGQ